MKVLLVNGSPHRNGETYHALSLVEKALHEKGITTEWFWVGNKSVVASTVGSAARHSAVRSLMMSAMT